MGKLTSRNAALNQAKRDAKIPGTQNPSKVNRVKMTDMNGRAIKNSNDNGNVIYTREYYYTNTNGKTVVIQEHSAGHPQFGEGPHFNVRPIDDLRNGIFPGTQAHYNFD